MTCYFSLFSGKAALRTGVPKARRNLDAVPGTAVKAGIGGFHTAVKQLAGKACNEVIAKDKVF